MNRREFIKKLVIYGGTLGVLGKLLVPAISADSVSVTQEYYRIVLLGDPHLPVRKHVVLDLHKQQKILDAKNRVVYDVNSWEDVNQIIVLGDIAAQFGNVEEYDYARQYFSQCKKTVSFIAGNHDYMYCDDFSPEGKFVLADAITREQKLNRFKETLKQPELFFSQKVGQYLLVFLSPDSLDSRHLTQISNPQINWLKNELSRNKTTPTIVFFHAPLAGTLYKYNKNVNTPNFISQPKETIKEILDDNLQIIMWVSGHTHTSAKNSSFVSNVNIFGGHITNIHNTDMDRERIWTNSLYLYPDRVLIKTFNHKDQTWEENLERTVYL
ncbi:metallophosphoesterase [Sporomusa acidovorans]|uniref:metallophosphoesterase family protein n=1 Tax=Sporomusa acidovorans TaxID=112900 RepID=UPI00146C11CB|nr:metallophosphoesterase [Sporomusa acidovorans]